MEVDSFTPAGLLWAAAASFAALAALAAWRDHARAARPDVDRVGCMPWTLALILALLLAVASAALALLV